MKYDIFVSYRRADRELVASVVRRLEARGVGVWYDANIDGGADWREAIVESLTNSDMLAIFFSEDCNNSRQLKKELAVADSLGKPVIPILIENTQPRGAFLYELADRNWIQIFPEPMERIEELVDHLATLAGKSDGGLSGAGAGLKTDKAETSKGAKAARKKAAPQPANDMAANDVLAGAPSAAPAPSATASAALSEEAEQPLTEAVGEFIAGTDQPSLAAPKIAKAYVGRVSDPGKPIRKLMDMPPFRWIDLAILVPAWIAIGWWIFTVRAATTNAGNLDAVMSAIGLFCVLFTGLFGAVVFPVRYYLRRRGLVDALLKYLASTFMIFVAAIGFFLKGIQDNAWPQSDLPSFLLFSAVVWLGFTLIAFLIYGLLAGQRAMKSFRSNIRKL